MGQLSLDKTYLLAPWVEALVYGVFLTIFCTTITLCLVDSHGLLDTHAKIMLSISCLMFFIATWHLAINLLRLFEGYVDHHMTPAAFMGNLKVWDHVLKDTLYATQENLGAAAAIYRTWVLWGHNWKVILLPSLLLIINIVAGYMVCGLYTTVNPTQTVFDPTFTNWIRTFYSITVVTNIITTGLMGYRIWKTARILAQDSVDRRKFLTVIRILVESAALQLIVEIVLLALYCSDQNIQYILLESVPSVVGITLNAITLRLKLYTRQQNRSLPTKSWGLTNMTLDDNRLQFRSMT
ncbi:hypothetical protein D9758_009066 [Tetrapyrgos nigripes]|uniref:Uncharacterized protein n=1 Tax=Tetrapyrgos nigripes TaxID=182062 RepID=A0A8H5GA11_9AGAR|nr:hypothetical protein D9758_009066 [Tetrapyrgos nigripes]